MEKKQKLPLTEGEALAADPGARLFFSNPSAVARRLLWHIYSLGTNCMDRPIPHQRFEKPGAFLFWVNSGESQLKLESGTFHLQPGHRLWLIDLQGAREYIPMPERKLRTCGFRFGGAGLESWLEELQVHKMPEFEVSNLPLVRRHYNDVSRLVRRRPVGWEWQVHMILTQILGQLLSGRDLLASPQAELPPPVVRVLNAISANPCRDWKSKELAATAKVSYSLLRALFHNSGQGTIHGHILQTRLDRARLLLADKRLSIKDVAAQLNFSSEFYFSHFFRNRTGMSPTQFRQHLKP
jgi:AraC-like DNA-binding protein